MASQNDISARIDAARKAGFSDDDIYSTLASNQGFSSRISMAKKEGFSDEQIAQTLGLKVQKDLGMQQPIKISATRQPFDWKAAQQKSMQDQAKKAGPTQMWESALLGASDLGAGITQTFAYAGDKLGQGLNSVLGTNFDTNAYKRFTNQRQDIEDFQQARRQQNGQGYDWARLGGQVAATAPLGALGRSYQGANVLSKAGAGVAAQNAAVGAAIGGAGFAGDANKRFENTAFGAVGSALGGITGKVLGNGIASVARKAGTNKATASEVDNVINSAFKQSDNPSIQGMTVSDLSQSAREGIRKEVKNLLNAGKQPDKKTLERIAVFSDLKANGVDLKPTGKQATGNPQLWTKETELSKLDGGEGLNQRYIKQGDELTQALDDFQTRTGGTSTGILQTGESILSALDSKDAARKQVINDLYKAAKDHTGNDLQLDASAVVRNAQKLIEENFALPDRAMPGLMSRLKQYLPKDNDPTFVPKSFTLRDKELIVKQINSALPKLDQQNKVAFGLVRDALEQETDDALMRATSSLQGQAKASWDAARKAASDRFSLINRSPALQEAINDAAPDKFFQKQVISANVRDVKALVDEIKGSPDALNNIRQEIIRYVASKTVSETSGNVSPKAMNDALKSIGDEKLRLFFSPDELKHLKNLNAAAKYLFSQPRGSNVNNSNSASAFANMMGYMGLLKKIPVVGPKVEQLANSGIRGVNAQIKINQGENALSRTAPIKPSPQQQSLIDRLVQAGLISGASAATQ